MAGPKEKIKSVTEAWEEFRLRLLEGMKKDDSKIKKVTEKVRSSKVVQRFIKPKTADENPDKTTE